LCSMRWAVVAALLHVTLWVVSWYLLMIYVYEYIYYIYNYMNYMNYIWIIWIIYEYHTNNYWKYHSSCLQVPKTIQHPSHPRLRLSHFKKSPYGETAGQGQHWQSAGESINTIATTPQPHKNHSKIVYTVHVYTIEICRASSREF
jgi:hypothetical protein